MKLYLVQHAKAASKDVDPQRPLTDEGRRDVRKIVAFIKPLKLSVDFLWHSGKIRAAQTAETLAKVVEVRTETTNHDGLAPNDDVAVLKDELDASDDDVMIVGHLPFLSKLASLLLTGDESAGTVAFQQGGIVALERSAEGQCQINWMVTPDLLA
ncbi:MAG: phosphohistidine phosphatase SixA [Planctomycetes bacterium RBG_16_55_9]|nr:MAG: phosphohistidine phosphatase SixA [Planctomycetes bacterium RBG_16_55_9]